MKQVFILLLILIVAGLAACDPVTFNEPQPVGVDNLKFFPMRLQGNYLSLEDSSTLIITGKTIKRVYDFNYKIHVNQLDSTYRITGNKMTNKETNEEVPIIANGDSLTIYIHSVDTIFRLSSDNIARKFKGYYFLNIRYDKESWVVQKVQLSKGKLTLSKISKAQDLEMLREVTESEDDTISPLNFTATKKQFEEFVKNEGFSDSEVFVRKGRNLR